MTSRLTASTVVRIAAIIALLATFSLQLAGSPASRAQSGGPVRVSYLFGSGSTHGGRPITMRVELTGPAPAGGAAVVLRSERPDLIPLPTTVTVPAGATELTFTNTTNPSDDDTYVRVSAGYGGRTMGREVQILEPRLRALYLQSVIRAGGQGKLTVCLSGEAPTGGIAVALTGDNQAALMVPATITVPAGSACRSIAVDAGAVEADTLVQVAARYKGVSLFRDTIVRDFSNPLPVFSFTIDEGDLPVASGGSVDILVCLTSGDVNPDLVMFDSSSSARATESPETGTFAAVGDCVAATLTDIESSALGSGNVRLQVRQGTTTLGESANISFPGDPAIPTATSTTEPTATNSPEPTATETTSTLSEGCQGLNDSLHDSVYFNGGQFGSFTAGEVITVGATAVTESSANTIFLDFTPTGGTFVSQSTAIPGSLTHTVQAAGPANVAWSTNGGIASWTVSCAAGPGDAPTATASEIPPTATDVPPTASATESTTTLSEGCAFVNQPGLDDAYLGFSLTQYEYFAGEVITVTASAATGSVAATLSLTYTPSGGSTVSQSTSIPGSIIYTVPATALANVGWSTDGGGAAVWTASCAAGPGDAPTATSAAEPTVTSTEAPTETATAEPTETATEEPTATAISTETGPSAGCTAVNLSFYDGPYGALTLVSLSYNAGEVITVITTAVTGSAATAMSLQFTPAGGTLVSQSTTIPGMLTYTVPATGDAVVSWFTNTGEAADWTASCAGPGDEPTATNTEVPPTATDVPPTATDVPPTATASATSANGVALSDGCQALNVPDLDGDYVSFNTFPFEFFAGEVISASASGSAATTFSLTFNAGGSPDSDSTTIPGLLTSTVPSTGLANVSWSTDSGAATWVISCAAGSGDAPTATNTEVPPTATSTEVVPTETATEVVPPTATSTATATETATAEPTVTAISTPTSTEVVTPLSAGCAEVNDPFLDNIYGNGGAFSSEFFAGEVITVSASGSSATMMSLTFTPEGGTANSESTTIPGALTYTVPATGIATAQWLTNGDSAVWTVSCTAADG